MPQYTIKLHTYDPDIVDAFERLRRNRKQAAFTHEALKHFIVSGKATQMIALMSDGCRPPQPKAAQGTAHRETNRDDVPVEQAPRPVMPAVGAERACDHVLKKIFE
jgi:hypothetical protein